MTNPSRVASKGRAALAGSALCVESTPHHVKPGKGDRLQARLGAAANGHIHVAALDHGARFADRVSAARARGDDGHIRPLDAELDGPPARPRHPRASSGIKNGLTRRGAFGLEELDLIGSRQGAPQCRCR